MMGTVVFYSNTGNSKKIAEYFAEQLNFPLVNIEENDNCCFDSLVLVFPVHCQNIPYAVKSFLEKVSVKSLTVVATYGKICCGNVIYEIQNQYKMNVVAGAYIPTKHSYVDDDVEFCDFDKLLPIIDKVKAPKPVKIPRLYKNPLANVSPAFRSRMGVKIYNNYSNCKNCNICAEKCSLNAIHYGIPSDKCMRCLKCVEICPKKALSVKTVFPLKQYLKRRRKNKIVIYV